MIESSKPKKLADCWSVIEDEELKGLMLRWYRTKNNTFAFTKKGRIAKLERAKEAFDTLVAKCYDVFPELHDCSTFEWTILLAQHRNTYCIRVSEK